MSDQAFGLNISDPSAGTGHREYGAFTAIYVTLVSSLLALLICGSAGEFGTAFSPKSINRARLIGDVDCLGDPRGLDFGHLL